MKNCLIVLVCSGLGGVVRHLLNVLVSGLAGSAFPWGILSVNVLGCSLMGVVVGWFILHGGASQELRFFLKTGVLGGFTTFSAFSLDTAVLYERGEVGMACL